MPKGKYSFTAGGKFNYPLGTASHAEGYKNLAIGEASHAEGQKTIAIGDYSHSQGLSTSANGDCSHAEGAYTQAGVPVRSCYLTNLNPSNQTVVIDGIHENDYSDDDKIVLTYFSSKKRYRARRKISNLIFDLDDNKTFFVISPPLVGEPLNLKVANQKKGRFSHAQGYKTRAEGDTSTAIGKNITVTGDTSVGIQLDKNPNNVLSQNNTMAIVGGKVGIETLNPEECLDVNGIVKIGNVKINPEGEISGVTQFSENIEILENTIRSTNQNGDLILSTDQNGSLLLDSNKISLGRTAKVRSSNQHAQSSAFFVDYGDAQLSKYFLIKQTSNSNLVTMTFDGNFESSENTIKIPLKCTWFYNVSIVAYNVTNNKQAAFSLKGALGNDGASTNFIGSPMYESFFDESLQNLQVNLDCSTGNFKIKVAGLSGNVIKWHCVVSTNEIYHEAYAL